MRLRLAKPSLTCRFLQATTIFKLDLENNEAAFSVAIVAFHTTKDELHLVVGSGQDTTLAPRTCTTGYLTTYKILEDGRSLELLHKTETDDVPTALIAFQGRLVAGVGKALRVYDLGKKKLLRKAENKASRTDCICQLPPLTCARLAVLRDDGDHPQHTRLAHPRR